MLKLTAVLGLNATGYEVGLKRGKSQAKAFASEIKSQFAGAFGTAAVIAFSKNLVDTADRVLDLSDRLAISTDSLQEWEYAAKRSSAGADSVRMFFESLAKNRADALLGNQNMIDSFGRLGVTLESLKTQRIDDIAKSIQKTVAASDPQSVLRDLRAIGEESAGQLIPAMQAFDQLAEKGRATGQVLSEETLVSLDNMKESALDLAEIFTGPVANSLAFIGGLIEKWANRFQALLNTFSAGVVGVWEGLNFEQLREMLLDTAAETLKEQEAKKQARANDRARKRAVAQAVPTELEEKFQPKAKKGKSASSPDLTEWQKLGASVRGMGNDPLLMETKRGIQVQKNMEGILKKIEKNTGQQQRGGTPGFLELGF